MKILMAIDGSVNALRALRFVLRHPMVDDRTAITLIQVDAPLNGHIASFLDAAAIEHYHERNSANALRGAHRVLRQMNRPHDELIRIGDAAEVIATTARRGRFDMIAMGSRWDRMDAARSVPRSWVRLCRRCWLNPNCRYSWCVDLKY